MDGANWLAHYADHRFDALWRFHALHHSQEELSVLTSFRAHPLMHTTGFIPATIPVVVLMPARPIAPVLIRPTSASAPSSTGFATFPSRRDGAGRTGLAGRPVPVEQDTPRTPVLLLVAGQLAEPFRSSA